MINRYLEILQLYPGASEEEIKTAYRKLAKKYHPDVYPEEGSKHFIEINEAYHFLLETGPRPHDEEVSYDFDPEVYEYREMQKRAREKAKEEAKEQAKFEASFLRKIYFTTKVAGLLMLSFNILLVSDFALEPIEKQEKVTNVVPNLDDDDCSVLFESGKQIKIDTMLVNYDTPAVIRLSPLFGKIKNAIITIDGSPLQIDSFNLIYNSPFLFFLLIMIMAVSYGMVWLMRDSIQNKLTVNIIFIFAAITQLVFFIIY